MDLHRLAVNTIKGLAMDAVQAADSGHPGMPMGMADAATVLWTEFLQHDPADPEWPDRDRFVLSAGHGSMLLYSLLHLAGYPLTLNDIRQFRQWGSATPGHPEHGHTAGVETTTGPLGQGFANGVGMAMAERLLRETFGADLVDHWTYAIVSDGDLMEGVAAEAASLAGHLGLGRIVYLYDDNHISIDGSTDLSFTEDRALRFEAYGWHTVAVDGHDPAAISAAIHQARSETDRPSLILCRTVIGQGSAKEGTSATHGAPLGPADVAATKARLGMDPDASFVVPDAVVAYFRRHEGARAHAAWRARLAEHPRAGELLQWLAGDVDPDTVEWPAFQTGSRLATRKASQACLKTIQAAAPWVVGGSADLAGSNGVALSGRAVSAEGFGGAGLVHFGVREHAMGAIANGMALHRGVVPFCATFLVFHDYMRPAVRLACLMKQRVVLIYSHDSVFLGEDGPTHQPIETLLAMRAIPGMSVLRPADAHETAACWKLALGRTDGPTALVITRQGLPILAETASAAAAGVPRGGYVLRDADAPEVIVVATGSEVATALAGAELLASRGTAARVVSMPSVEGFLAQDEAYRASVLSPGVPVLSVEAGVTLGWERIVGATGASLGIDRFGASAPIADLAREFGFTAENVANRALALLSR